MDAAKGVAIDVVADAGQFHSCRLESKRIILNGSKVNLPSFMMIVHSCIVSRSKRLAHWLFLLGSDTHLLQLRRWDTNKRFNRSVDSDVI